MQVIACKADWLNCKLKNTLKYSIEVKRRFDEEVMEDFKHTNWKMFCLFLSRFVTNLSVVAPIRTSRRMSGSPLISFGAVFKLNKVKY